MQGQAVEHAKLIRTMTHALRHAPDEYLLDLTAEGWATIDDLLGALRLDRRQWRQLRWEDVEEAIRAGEPGRFEIDGGRIRAAYGHSIPFVPTRKRARPPETLLHATALAALPDIFCVGLRPMRRRFVHLTTSADYARRILESADGGALLLVDARAAHEAGVAFYRATEHAWLVSELEHRFLQHAIIDR